MNAWDILWWTATAFVVARIVVERRERLWIVAGLLIGVGMETKWSMGFLVAGLGAGLLLTRERQWIRSRWLWAGAAIAVVVAAPHFVWQIANGWPTLEFIRNANELKNAQLTPLQFLGSHLLELHPVNALLAAVALVHLFGAENGRFRLFGWAYVTIFLLIFVQNGKTYYLSPAFPFVLAGGSAGLMRLLSTRPAAVRVSVLAVVLVAGAVTAPAAFPLLPIDRYITYTQVLGLRPPDAERNETAELPQFFADMFGWDAIVRTTAEVYRGLPLDDQAKVAIVAPNYGVAGAIDFLGPRHGLPVKAISPHNSYYLWGYGHTSGDVLIVIGGRADELRQSFAQVEQAATIDCGYCMPSENRPVYVVRGPKRPVAELWATARLFI
jgi:4-amino-4-deoxy-L-arabinose transferase-like glycosyltransferase